MVADALALLSEYQETFGLAVNEAMNFRPPSIVVSDRVWCAADLVNEDRNGYAVGAGHGDGVIFDLSRLFRHGDLRERMESAFPGEHRSAAGTSPSAAAPRSRAS